MMSTIVLSASLSRWRNCHERYYFHPRCSVGCSRHCGTSQGARCEAILRAARPRRKVEASRIAMAKPPRSRAAPEKEGAMKPLTTVAVHGLLAIPAMPVTQACSSHDNQPLRADEVNASSRSVTWIGSREIAWLAFIIIGLSILSVGGAVALAIVL